MKRRILVLFLALLVYAPTLVAGNPNVINFTRDTYQAANKNWSISCDSQGLVYFGNDNGLLEFDGINWVLNQLPQSRMVRSVAVGRSGEIYTGGNEEFGVWTRNQAGRLTYQLLSDKIDRKLMSNNDIWRIVIVEDTIYFQSFSRVFKYSAGEIKVISPKGGLLQLMQTQYGLWAQNIHGSLMRLVGEQFVGIAGSELFSSTDVQFILPYTARELLIGTSTMGLYLYDGTQFTRWMCNFTHPAVTYRLNRGIRLKNGNFIFGTILNGIYEVSVKGNVINHFSTDNWLQNNTVLSLMEDSDGQNVWVALDRGISYIAYLPGCSCHTDSQGRIGAVYTAATFADRLFVGTNQGLYYIPLDKFSSSNVFAGLKLIEGTQGQVWDLKCWNGKLLCGHNSGLIVVDAALKPTKPKQPNSGVTTICIVANKGEEYILLGTYDSMVALNDALQPINIISNLGEPISAICADATGDIWLRYAKKGVCRLHFDEITNHISPCSEFGKESDPSLPESLQVFAFGRRVVFYGNNTFYVYDYAHNKLVPFPGLNDCFKDLATIQQIVCLSDQRYLALTENVAYTFITKDRKAEIVSRNLIGTTNFSLVNRYENAVALNDTLCMICLDNGFLLKDIRPENNVQITPQRPYLRSIIALSDDGKRQRGLSLDKHGSVPYKNNTLRFGFAVARAMADKLSFQYRLCGLNNEWSKPSRVSTIEFGRLRRGSYLFQLRATDNMGIYSEVCEYQFTVNPPWSLSLWAFFIYIVLLVGVILFVRRLMLRRYRHALRQRLRLEEEKRLKRMNQDLQHELRQKDAELLSKTSFIMQKNQMIQDIKRELDHLYEGYKGSAILRQAYLRMNIMLNRNLDAQEDWKLFLVQFEQTNSGFFKRLQALSPDLTPSELKVAACLRLNLASKEIAALINISIRAVENSRHLLRKKLDIPLSVNLNEFFINL